MEEVEEIRHKKGMKELYSLRSQTIERVFADAKELYQMRYTRYRGIKRVTMELTLKFACMNLKKLAVWKDRDSIKRAISHGFFIKLLKNLLNLKNKVKNDYLIL